MVGLCRAEQPLLSGQISRWPYHNDHNGKLLIAVLNADGSANHRLQQHWQYDAASQRMNTVTTSSDGKTPRRWLPDSGTGLRAFY